jgi:hypothetical protein
MMMMINSPRVERINTLQLARLLPEFVNDVAYREGLAEISDFSRPQELNPTTSMKSKMV